MFLYYKQIVTRILADFTVLHHVLSGFTLYLTSHFVNSSSNHSYGYDKVRAGTAREAGLGHISVDLT